MVFEERREEPELSIPFHGFRGMREQSEAEGRENFQFHFMDSLSPLQST